MTNDPLGLFDDEENDPLGLFSQEDTSSFGDKALGAVDALGAMFAGTPAQIAGGLRGAGDILLGRGVDSAVRKLEETQKSNFGLGEYKPVTKKGKEYSEKVSGWLEKPVELASDFGEKIAGNEGRYVGELLTRSAMELIDPAVGVGLAAKGLKGRKPKLKSVSKDQAALNSLPEIKEDMLPNPADPLNLFPETELNSVQRGAAALQDEILMDRLRQVDTDQTVMDRLKNIDSQIMEPDPAVQGRLDDMQAQELQGRLREIDRMLNEQGTSVQGEGTIPVTPEGQGIIGDPSFRDEMQTRQRSAQADQNTELFQEELFDQPESGRVANPFEAALGDWRIDENGMPVKADLSMEANNLENPLQRNLWGDELPMVRSTEGQAAAMQMDRDIMGHEQMSRTSEVPINDVPLTQAIDNMPDLPWKAERDNAIQLLTGEIKPDGPMRAAKMRADQGGFIDPKLMLGLGAGAGALAYGLQGDNQDKFVAAGVGAAALMGLRGKKYVAKAMGKQKDGTFIPDDPTPEELEASLVKARSEKDGRSLQYMDSGAVLTAMKRGSTAIALTGELIGNAFKRADLAIREHVFPAERALKKLSRQDLEILSEVFKKEMFRERQFTEAELNGFSPKLLNAYRQLREMFDDSLRIQNEARVAKGQKPITAVEAYLSSRWQGDFRRPLYNKDGKLVWYLASDTKMGLDAQTRSVLKDHPGLVYDPKKDHTVRFRNRKTDLESAYTTMIDILDRNDPAVATIAKYMEDQTTARGATFLAQEKHFKKKGNIRGFIGDRPELKVNDYFDRNIPFIGERTVGNSRNKDVLDFFQQQIQYSKNAYRWSELQKAGQPLKKILNDPELVAQQPKNIEFIREYFKHAIGYGESVATRAISDSLRNTGFSPVPFDKGVSGLKTFFILQKLGGNLGKLTADVVQLSMLLPHMMDLRHKGFKGNPLMAYTSGLVGGLTIGSTHLYNSVTGNMNTPKVPGWEFLNRASRYAEENGITARSIYDESPIENSFSIVGKTANGLGKTMTIPETYMRSVAFMAMSQFLKDSGKFKNELDLFKEAEKRTNVAMVDYAQTERPMIFNKLGTAGNFLNTLQTYSWNFYNQQAYYVREASKGNYMPLVTALAVQYMVAGAMGIPGFEDGHSLWMKIKDALPAREWAKVQQNEFLAEPKLWMLKNLGSSSVYGYLSDKSGIGLTTRVAAPAAGQMLQSPAGPITDIGRQLGAGVSLALDPTNSTKQAQAAMLSTPTGLQGLLETAPFMEGHTWNNRLNQETGEVEKIYNRPTKLAEREGLVTRTPRDEAVRRFGLRTQDEVIKRDVGYATKRDTVAAASKARDIPTAFYDAVRRNNMEDAKEYYKTYTFLTGKKLSREAMVTQIKQEFMTDIERQQVGAKKSVQALLNVKRMEEVFDAIEKETK